MMQNPEQNHQSHQRVETKSSYLGTDSHESTGRYTFVLSSLIRPLTKVASWAWSRKRYSKNHEEDIARKKHALTIIVTISTVLIWIMTATVVHNFYNLKGVYNGVHPLPFFLIACFCTILLILLKKNFVDTVSYGIIFLFVSGATYGGIVWGIDMQMTLLAYVIAILIIFTLEQTRKAILLSSLTCIVIALVWHLEFLGIIAVDRSWRSQVFNGDVYDFVIMFVIIIAIAWLGKREISLSLQRARISEASLKIERDNLEIKVQERTAEVQRMQAEKISELYRFSEFGRLSAGIFHDLSSPLTALNTSIHKLKESEGRIYHISDDVERISKASNRLGQLVSAVRKIVTQTDEHTRFLVFGEITDVCDLLRYKAQAAYTELHVEGDKNILFLGNPLKFHQIILNLVANAIDACEESPLTQNYKSHTVTINCIREERAVRISVTDTGAGIPEHIKEKIFNPLFTTKTREKGTGIGLSQTKNLVEKEFSGTIFVESIPGKTTFTITLPVK